MIYYRHLTLAISIDKLYFNEVSYSPVLFPMDFDTPRPEILASEGMNCDSLSQGLYTWIVLHIYQQQLRP